MGVARAAAAAEASGVEGESGWDLEGECEVACKAVKNQTCSNPRSHQNCGGSVAADRKRGAWQASMLRRSLKPQGEGRACLSDIAELLWSTRTGRMKGNVDLRGRKSNKRLCEAYAQTHSSSSVLNEA